MSQLRTGLPIATPVSETPRRLAWMLSAAAVVVGIGAWAYYWRAGLVLSHYDAKAHLVVARRVIDNLTPGWQQFGAVWLPLPHLLLVLPVQSDLLYRTGAAGSAISLGCLGITTYALATLMRRMTDSAAAAVSVTALVALNPNLLYLSTTPMTEPLLLALTSLVVLWTHEWVVSERAELPLRLRWALAAATWTRYEAWLVVGAAGVLAAVARFRRGSTVDAASRGLATYAAWPLAAAALFAIDSRITVGRWFVSEGFFVPDATYAGRVGNTLNAIAEGTAALSSTVLLGTAALGALGVLARGLGSRRLADAWVALAFFATALLPFVAFYDGHPFRIRYMTPLVVASAVAASVLVGWLPRRVQWLGVVALVGGTLWQSPPLTGSAPMVREAQLDRPAGVARRAVSTCLAEGLHGEKVLASMGSLAHYMQELAEQGLHLRDFVHEGNGVIWEVALEQGPAPHAGWMLVEEVAEGGDVLAHRIRRDPSFVRGMRRVCAAGGVSLYRRTEAGV